MIVWKILDIQADDELITHAKYYASVSENGRIVETEGNWKFSSDVASVPFNQVTEAIVIDWIQKDAVVDGKNIIEARLLEQLAAITKQNTTVAPWMPQVFTPNI